MRFICITTTRHGPNITAVVYRPLDLVIILLFYMTCTYNNIIILFFFFLPVESVAFCILLGIIGQYTGPFSRHAPGNLPILSVGYSYYICTILNSIIRFGIPPRLLYLFLVFNFPPDSLPVLCVKVNSDFIIIYHRPMSPIYVLVPEEFHEFYIFFNVLLRHTLVTLFFSTGPKIVRKTYVSFEYYRRNTNRVTANVFWKRFD